MGRADHDLTDLHGARLRTHGGIAEREVPFILSHPLNRRCRELAESDQLMNYRIIEFALNGSIGSRLRGSVRRPCQRRCSIIRRRCRIRI